MTAHDVSREASEDGNLQRIHLKREPDLTPKHRAFAYQSRAVEAIRDLEFAAVFHEQGLGKTKIAVDIMLYWLEKKAVDTVLLIVKKGLLENWNREIKMHTHINPRILTQNRKNNFYVFNSPARLMLAHFEVMRSEEERFSLFLKSRSVGVIIDESAKIKNPASSLTKSFFLLAPLFSRRIIMTGTPVANRPHDIWAQVWFLDQGASLGNDFSQFRRDLNLSGDLADDEESQHRFERELGLVCERISSFSVRETKNSGVISLPSKEFETIQTEWESHQMDLYKQVRDTLRVTIVREGVPSNDETGSILKRLLRLVQIACNPRLIDDGYCARPGKMDALEDLVTGICRRKEKCIVWTTFTANADYLARELRPYGSLKVHGKMAMPQRMKALDRFLSEPESRVLIATPGAAKEGLTLTVANHAIFYDRGFSLDDYAQSQDRIHRISQKRICYIYNLVMTDSIDEWIDVLLHAKRLAAQLTQGDISLEFYESQASYSFGEVLRRVLGLDGS